MQITIADRCFTSLGSWLTQSYSPHLTNVDKILANLKRIGHIDREEWSNSFDIICNALGLYDLTLVYEMAIENIRLNKANNLIIDISFTMLNPDTEPSYASFALDSTLNLLEDAKEQKTVAVSLSAEGVENIQPAIHPNVNANSSNCSLSKNYHSLPFFPQLCRPTTTPNSSVNEHLTEQLTRSPTPGLVQE